MILIWRVMILAAVAVVMLQMSCTSVIAPDDIPGPLPDDLALFASFDGNWAGIKVINPNTLTAVDSLEGADRQPIRLAFSPNYQEWYFTTEQGTGARALYAIEVMSKSILRTVSTQGRLVTTDHQQRYLITYGGPAGIVQIYERLTFQILHTDSLGPVYWSVASPTQNRIYIIAESATPFSIISYDLDSFAIEKVLTFGEFSGKTPTALIISYDGRYLFLTTFTWMGFGGVGTFYAIDLSTEAIIAKYDCGSYSQLGESPDGKYVYITDPAGYLYELFPTGRVLRYDVHNKTMEVFIDSFRDIGLTGGYAISDRVIIAPDNRTMFLTLGGNLRTLDGRLVHMIKLDTHRKEILASYSIPPDHRGYITQRFVDLKLGKYPGK